MVSCSILSNSVMEYSFTLAQGSGLRGQVIRRRIPRQIATNNTLVIPFWSCGTWAKLDVSDGDECRDENDSFREPWREGSSGCRACQPEVPWWAWVINLAAEDLTSPRHDHITTLTQA